MRKSVFQCWKNDVTKKKAPKIFSSLFIIMFSILNIGKIIADNNPGIALVTSSWNSIYARSKVDYMILIFSKALPDSCRMFLSVALGVLFFAFV